MTKATWQKGLSIKDIGIFFGHFWYPPPPCRNSNPDLPNFYLLISFNIEIWDPPPKILRRFLWMDPNDPNFDPFKMKMTWGTNSNCPNLDPKGPLPSSPNFVTQFWALEDSNKVNPKYIYPEDWPGQNWTRILIPTLNPTQPYKDRTNIK